MGSLNIIVIYISILFISLLDAHGYQQARYRCLHTTHIYRPCTIIYNTGIKYGNRKILKYVYPSEHSLSVSYLASSQDGDYNNEDVSINSSSNVTDGILYESIGTTIIQSQIQVASNIPIVNSNVYDDSYNSSSSSSSATVLLATTYANHSNNVISHDINLDINISRTNLTINTVVIPTIKELMTLGFPILGIWLLQPILSLVDSSILGLSPSVTVSELASLGPGIGFVDSTLYMFQFLGIATTNLYVTSLNEGNPSKSRVIISNSIAISTILGIILSCLQYLFAPYAIQLLSGTARQSIPYGIKYARIRSLSSPFSLLIIIGQALFLASKDSITPLKSTIIGAVVNLVVDVIMVMILKTGVVGAAFATCLSQVISALYLLYIAVMNNNNNNNNSSRKQSRKNGNDCNNKDDNDGNSNVDVDVDVDRDCLNRPVTIDIIRNDRQVESRSTSSSSLAMLLTIMKSYFVLPSYTEICSYLHFSSSLFIILFIKTFLWTFTTYACSVSGVVALAAHQITLNVFLFFCIFGDVLSQLGQTLLPSYLTIIKKPTTAEVVANAITAATTASTASTATTTTDDVHDMQVMSSEFAYDSSDTNRNSKDSSSSSINMITLDRSIDDDNDDDDEGIDNVSLAWNKTSSSLLKQLLRVGVIIGFINLTLCQLMRRYFYKYFTSSTIVITTMESVSLLLSLSVLPHSIMLSLEGALLASKDFKFQSNSYLLMGLLFVSYQAMVRHYRWGIIGVWIGTTCFQYLRMMIFGLRLHHLLKISTDRSKR